MDDLIAFITARLGEDEAAANEALQETTGRWAARETVWPGGLVVEDECGAQILPAYGAASSPQYPHIARHDPARVLREVAVKRAILVEHAQFNDSIWCKTCDPAGESGDSSAWYPCKTVRTLADVWSDHPDYRQEWAPDRALPAHGRPRAHLRRPPAHRPPLGSRRPLAAHHRQASHVLARRRATVIRAQAQPWQAAPFCTTREHAAHHPA